MQRRKLLQRNDIHPGGLAGQAMRACFNALDRITAKAIAAQQLWAHIAMGTRP